MQYDCISVKTRRCPQVLLIKHRSVPGRAFANVLRDCLKFLELCRYRTVNGRSLLKSYNLNFKTKSSDARPMCANADRAPSGLCTVYGRCHFILNSPTKRRSGAMELLVVLKLHRAPYDVYKLCFGKIDAVRYP